MDPRRLDPTPPETDITVRAIRPGEHALVGALVEDAFRTGGAIDDDEGYAAHLRDVEHRVAEHPVLVAERAGQVVGSVTLTPFGTPQAFVCAGPDELELRYLGVAPDAWGTGVGQALVAACEDEAVRRGAARLVLCVISTNTAAQAFYRRLGFTPVPSRDVVPQPGVHLTVWSRPVGA